MSRSPRSSRRSVKAERATLLRERRIRASVLVALAVAALASSSRAAREMTLSATTPAAPAQGRSAILFAGFAAGGHDTELYRVLPNGRRLQTLTRDRVNEDMPAWSYDRRRIAFVRSQPSACPPCLTRIWTADTNGGNLRRLTHTSSSSEWYETEASWSPNGRSLVLSRFRGTQAGIYTVRRDGSHLRLIVSLADSDPEQAHPAWGASGWIAFASYAADDGGIFLVRPDGSGLRKLTDNTPEEALSNLSWNGSGSRIAFAQPRLGRIVTANAETGAAESIIAIPPEPRTEAGWQTSIAWSPNSRSFAFDRRGHIYLIDADGRNLRRLGATNPTFRKLRALEPAWR